MQALQKSDVQVILRQGVVRLAKIAEVERAAEAADTAERPDDAARDAEGDPAVGRRDAAKVRVEDRRGGDGGVAESAGGAALHHEGPERRLRVGEVVGEVGEAGDGAGDAREDAAVNRRA